MIHNLSLSTHVLSNSVSSDDYLKNFYENVEDFLDTDREITSCNQAVELIFKKTKGRCDVLPQDLRTYMLSRVVCEQITCLKLRNVSIHPDDFKLMAQAFTHVSEIDLSGTKIEIDLLGGERDVSRLKNRVLPQRIDDQVIAILPSFSNLQKVNLSHCYNITGKSLETLKRISSLKEVNLTGCYQLSLTKIQNLSQLKNLSALKFSTTEDLIRYPDITTIGKTLDTIHRVESRHPHVRIKPDRSDVCKQVSRKILSLASPVLLMIGCLYSFGKK
jgi:hypothetical protein